MLGGTQGHPPRPYFIRQKVFDPIFDLEIAVLVLESRFIRTAFRPNVPESIRASKFERNQMIQFANLKVSGIGSGLLNSIPLIGDVLLGLARLAIADTPGLPVRVSQHCDRDSRSNPSRRALGIRDRIPVTASNRARSLLRFVPWSKVPGIA